MTNYGTIIDNTLRPSPRAFMLNGAMVTNPKAEHFAALNEERAKKGLPPYLPIVDEPPQTDAAHYAVGTGWARRDGETARRGGASTRCANCLLRLRAGGRASQSRRHWRRLGCSRRPSPISRKWTLPRGTPPPRRWTDCDYIEEGYGGDEKWNAILDGAAQALGKTRAEIDAFLGSLPTE